MAVTTSLKIVTQVANHPRVVALRQQQINMRNRFVRDYGNDFMGTEDAAYELNNGQEGVNRWTAPERKAYNNLTARARVLREALRAHYESV